MDDLESIDVQFKKRVAAVAFEGITDQQMLDGYRIWADKYDEDTSKIQTIGHCLVAQGLAEFFPADTRAHARILDIGAGTGDVGQELRKAGFQHIDALDASKEMLDKAREKGLYEQYYEEFITEEKLPIPENTYDGLVGSGIFAEAGHVQSGALKEMIRLVKPGGYVVLVTRAMLLTMKTDLEPAMAELETSGQWRQVDRTLGPNMYLNNQAITWRYQVL